MTLPARLRAAVGGAGSPVRGDWDVSGSDWDIPGGDCAGSEALTPAAVLIAVVTHSRPTLLLTRRTTTLRSHAGQIAFPGGRIDPEDSGPVAAALREAYEEVALDPAAVEVIGATDAYETITGYHITPIVGLIAPGLPLVPAAAEVDSIFEVPLDHVLDPANHQLHSREWQGRLRHYYVIAWEAYQIWGATAAIVVNLSRRLR